MPDMDESLLHGEFTRWYTTVSLGDDRTRRNARWEGINGLARGAERNMVEGLLRLAFHSRHTPSADVLRAVREAFRATDETFEMSGNDRELRILAGACLAVVMEMGDSVGAIAALSATTSGFGGARRPNLPMDLVALGETAIARQGDAVRCRPSLDIDSNVRKNLYPRGSEKKISEEQTFDRVEETIGLLEKNASAVLAQLAETQSRAIESIGKFLRVQDEELQMLWWLTSQRSSQLDCAFHAIPVDAQPLVLGNELARHTEFLPGPPSVTGILCRAGLSEHKSVRIADAVNAADPEWLQGLVLDVEPSFVTTPLHGAINRQLETGPGEAWVPGWAASTGVDPDYSCSVLELGTLFYRERLLCSLRDDGR